jgi:hypothetical protein
VPLEGSDGSQTACSAMRCGLQHPVAAAHDCQEGGDLLELALFAPAKVRMLCVNKHLGLDSTVVNERG